MQTVTLSPKFQVVIPQAVREALGLRPGEKFQVLHYEGRIEFIPVRQMKLARGLLRPAPGAASSVSAAAAAARPRKLSSRRD